MPSRKFHIEYAPEFERKLYQIAGHIWREYGDLDAAERFVLTVETLIQKRANSGPDSFEKCISQRTRQHSFYRIYLRKWVIYYVVDDDKMRVVNITHYGI